MGQDLIFFLALFLPLITSGVVGLVWRPKNPKYAGGIASLAVLIPFVCLLALFSQLGKEPIVVTAFTWLKSGTLHVPFEFLIDELSILMGLVVTGVGGLIHIFAIGYMYDDKTPYRFFGYLNLFIFAMLVLVFGASLPMMFIGWEGVGLCSYLLIGYGYTHMPNAVAGMKAFVVNRIGDLGFILGIFGVYALFQSVSFTEIKAIVGTGQLVAETHWGLINLTALCLFIGAVGKSAQIPLYVWLPDAMAGPTPVSALIHAATMVTSGLVMMTRMGMFFDLAPLTLTVVLWVGALTALLAAIIGIAQNDIKKVLAYSTVSQLGYMFAAMGVGAYAVGMFHVFTHAFFKALLFLGSGSVILALHHEQDMKKMGGLKKRLPVTYWTMWVGTLALAGILPFAGFFSKDEILFSVFSAHHWGPYILLLGGAYLTAFYMTRLMTLTFGGSYRGGNESHVSEGSWVVKGPLVVLAILSAGAGFLGLPHFLGHNIFGGFLSGFQAHAAHGDDSTAALLAAVSMCVALSGIATGYALYVWRPQLPWKISVTLQPLHQLVLHKFYVDELYHSVIVRPVVGFGKILWRVLDVKCIDGAVNGVARAIRFMSAQISIIQTGNVQTYAAFMILGGLLILSLIFNRGWWLL